MVVILTWWMFQVDCGTTCNLFTNGHEAGPSKLMSPELRRGFPQARHSLRVTNNPNEPSRQVLPVLRGFRAMASLLYKCPSPSAITLSKGGILSTTWLQRNNAFYGVDTSPPTYTFSIPLICRHTWPSNFRESPSICWPWKPKSNCQNGRTHSATRRRPGNSSRSGNRKDARISPGAVQARSPQIRCLAASTNNFSSICYWTVCLPLTMNSWS